MSNNTNIVDDLFSAVDTLEDIYEEHQDKIDGLLDGGEEVRLADSDMIAQIDKGEDRIKLAVDTQTNNKGDISESVDEEEKKLSISVPGDSITFELPGDCVIEEIEWSFKNGVMDITIPRDNGGVEDGDN